MSCVRVFVGSLVYLSSFFIVLYGLLVRGMFLYLLVVLFRSLDFFPVGLCERAVSTDFLSDVESPVHKILRLAGLI